MKKHETVKANYQKTQTFRFFGFSFLILNNLFFILVQGYPSFLNESLKYLTNWGHNFEIFFFILAYYETKKSYNLSLKNYETDMQQSFLCHLHSTLLGLQFLITFFYWFVIFDLHSYERSKYDWYRDVYLHSVPLLLIFIEFWLNKMEIMLKHAKLMCIFTVFYGFINLFFTVLEGKPVYFLLDFKNMNSVYFLVGALITANFGMLSFKFLEIFKRTIQK